MRRVAIALLLVAAPAHAAPDDEDEDTTDVTGDDEEEDTAPPKVDAAPKKPAPKPFVKQDLTGHDLAGTQKANRFERDRFFVDKIDDEKTEKKTLIQGSLTSTSFAYAEAGDDLYVDDMPIDPQNVATAPSNSQFVRVFTDLRLQTDFRHIGGGAWDARVDVRARGVLPPGNLTVGAAGDFEPVTPTATQSGLLGRNELEAKELWIARSGTRADLTFGRQFVADLGGVKFDGLRLDYAKSSRLTYLGFGGLYPIRGSRSINTDYAPLLNDPDGMGVRGDAGRFTATGGFGAAYRTDNAYGSFGGVVIAPFQSDETPRVYATATGYWRSGSKLDLYHFAIVDVLGEGTGVTNLSAGLNYKPDQRLRLTLSVNRVDTETLNVQAQAFLQDPERQINVIQNEALIARIAQNQARASLSAGLGARQRFEVTVAGTARYRGEVTLTSPVDPQVATPLEFTLPPGQSVEVFGSIIDRRSFKDARIGVDVTRIFKIGNDTYNRTDVLAGRLFVAREAWGGRAEWEAELGYANTTDDKAGVECGPAEVDILLCYGAAKSSVISLGSQMYYRFNGSWFGMFGVAVTRQSTQSQNGMLIVDDPPILGASGFARFAYRF
jgi:hypothetical protein